MKMTIHSIFMAVALTIPAFGTNNFSVFPFLQLQSDSSVAVMWRTETPAFSWLEYGSSTSLSHTAFLVSDGLRDANTKRHRIVLNNLIPNASLSYQAVCKPIINFQPYSVTFTNSCSTPVYSFKMLPDTTDTVRVVIFNDLHNRQATLDQLIQHIGGFAYDFSLFNGDCFADLPDETSFLNVLGDYTLAVRAAERPVIFHRGNHETRGAYARHIRDWLKPPGGHFYSAFSAGPVRFILLDTGEDKDDSHPVYAGLNDFETYRREQAEFLRKEIQSPEFNQARYRVLVHHIPLYDTSQWTSSFSRDIWNPVLSNVPISLAVCGHTHSYAIRQKGAAGNPYPVIIGGGQEPEKATMILLEADEKHLNVRILNTKGKKVGSLSIPASP